MKTKIALVGALALGLLASVPALADDAHHPAGTPSTAAAPPPVTQVQPAPGMPMGAGQGMMCPMMGQGSMMGMGGMADMASHIDGHLAFIKAELKITPAQEDAWKGFADVLRASAASMAQMQGMPMAAPGTAQTVSQALDQKERLLAIRLDNSKRLRTAWVKLDAALTPEQRKAAEGILVPRLMMM